MKRKLAYPAFRIIRKRIEMRLRFATERGTQMNRAFLTAGLLAVAAASQVSALTLTFTDRGTWTSQITGLTNFDGGTQAAGTSLSIANGGLFSTNLQINGYGINLSSPLNLIRANAGPSSTYYNWGTGTIITTQDKTAGNTVFARISFASPVSAFGFNYGAGGCPTYFAGCTPGSAASVTISPGGLASQNITTVANSPLNFWGVVSDSQTFTFADIFINTDTRYLVLDDIAQGSFNAPPPPSETAEPGTLLQIGLAAVLFAFARRKFSSAQSQTA